MPFLSAGTMILSAVLKRAGHEAEVLITEATFPAERAAAVSRAGLLGFYCATGSEKWLESFLSPFGNCPPVVLGGPHPTFVPEVIRDGPADFAIRGEAEGALPELLGALNGPPERLKDIRNLCFMDNGEFHVAEQRDLVQDLDSLPFQDIAPYMRYPFLKEFTREFYPVITSRGCPHNCTYCFNKKFKEMHRDKGKYTRRRSPANVVEELKKVKRDYCVRKCIFEDDSFIVSRPWLEEFAEMFAREIGIPFICQTPAASLDAETVELLAEMDCISVRIGVETADEENRREILGKRVANQQISEAAALLKKRGILIQTFNMVGIPGEGFGHAMNTMLFNRNIGADFTWVSFYHHYPGTELCEKHGAEPGSGEPADSGESFFTPGARVAADRRLANLGMLMQFFNATRMPAPLVKFLVLLPLSPFYRIVHKISYALSIKKINRLGWLSFISISLRSKKYF